MIKPEIDKYGQVVGVTDNFKLATSVENAEKGVSIKVLTANKGRYGFNYHEPIRVDVLENGQWKRVK